MQNESVDTPKSDDVKKQDDPNAAQPSPLEAHPDEIENPEITGYFSVFETPDGSISINISISPKDEKKAIGSFTTGFYRSQGGVVQASIGGTNLTATPPAAGQKLTGGTSEKKSAFPPLTPGEVYEAILQGNLTQDGEPAGDFFLTRNFDVTEAEG